MDASKAGEAACALSQAVGVASGGPDGWGAVAGPLGAAGPGNCTSQATGPPDASSDTGGWLSGAWGTTCRGAWVWPAAPKVGSDPHPGCLHHLLLGEGLARTLTWPRQVSSWRPSKGPVSQLLLP